jgi:signal transduction histidine kinase
MEETEKRSLYIIATCLALAAVFFLIDIFIPLGVAGSVLYVAVVLVSLWVPHRNIVIYIALLCSFLTVLGYFTSPAGGELLKVFANRFLALFAIWVTVVLGLGRRRAEDSLKETLENLEKIVEERTRDLKKAQKKLLSKERLAAIGQLSSNIAHELRNPLGVIGNTAYYLNMKLKDGDEKVLKHLDILGREVRRSNKIISCLLDFSRTKEPSIVACDINRVIKESLTDIEKDEKVSKVTIDTRLDGNLPEILIDPDQINQVILNLLTNAVHATPEGGRIEITTGVKKDFLEVVLKDTGAGIPKEDLRKIFEPLYTTKAKGTGLGLSIVRGIIDSHKGKIGVESKVGEGTTFTVSLPLERKEA